ncbi:MAG: fibronectin type III domain-containing protein, partial [Candidatus Zixiibacteriota bacterium]
MTSKLSCPVLSTGAVYRFSDDYGSTYGAFDYPVGSGLYYLFVAHLWCGGVVAEDTLMTSPRAYEWPYEAEFVAPESPVLGQALRPVYMEPLTTYRSHYVDTFITEIPYPSYNPHQPLHLSVVQKSYTLDANPYRDVLLLDFIFTNIGIETIKQAYVGIYLDGDACSRQQYAGAGYHDDLAGSLRDISTAYIIDNDGDPANGLFVDGISPIDGIGLRPVMVYPAVTDTNFNWWTGGYENYSDSAFQPRQRGTPDDPFREYLLDYNGPVRDSNRYYILRHNEWDYDQVFTATIDSMDSVWLLPDSREARYIAKGADTRFLLSVGPVGLPPDSSMRAVFALFGTEFVHVDPANRERLWRDDYEGYYDCLHFGLMRRTAERAVEFAGQVLDPLLPPTGLSLVEQGHDSVVLRWDPWVLPDVIGCNIYVRPVEDYYYIAPAVAVAPQHPINMGSRSHFFPAGRTTGVITGLEPGRLYFVAVSHVTESGEGELSPPIVVGYEFLDAVNWSREFIFFTQKDTDVVLTWEPSDDPRVDYYRIYKTIDTSQYGRRFYPFYTDDSSLIAVDPIRCSEIDGRTFYYYEIEPYDSTRTNVGYYADPEPVDGAIYWVASIGELGYPGRYSDPVTAEKVEAPQKELVVIVGAGSSEHDYVYP